MIRFFNKYTRFYGLTLSIMSMFVLVHFEGTLTAGVLADVCVENDNIYLSTQNSTYYFDMEVPMCSGPYDDHNTCRPHLCATSKVMELYAESLYVSMSLTSFFMLVGVAQIAVLFGHLGLLLQSKYQASAAFRMKLDRVKAECEYYKVPWDLQNRGERERERSAEGAK